jgi:hypothetical protein
MKRGIEILKEIQALTFLLVPGTGMFLWRSTE